MKRVLGKNIGIKISDKILAGNSDVKWANTAKTETSLIKADDGEEQEEVVGFERKISISGVQAFNEDGDSTTQLDPNDLELAMEVGTALAFVYGTGVSGEPERSGNLQILSYSEDSAASGYGSWSIEAKVLASGYTHSTTA